MDSQVANPISVDSEEKTTIPNPLSSPAICMDPAPLTPLTSPKVEFLRFSESGLTIGSAPSSTQLIPKSGAISTSTPTPSPSGPRRSSSRSIKRPKFDDELVETSALKRSSSRKTSESSPSDAKLKKSVSKHSPLLQPKRKLKKIKAKPVPVDFGRWRPTDDLALITAVSQSCDLQAVHLAVKFSCNFSLKEIQERWFALLYDPLVSRLAQQSLKALPSETVNRITNDALWSKEEDQILMEISMDKNPTLDDFNKCLDENITTFHKSRTAITLEDHWKLLRHYHLLSCQPAKNISSTTTLADMESKLIDDQIARQEDDDLNQELSYTDRARKREIRRLEEEIPQWEVMLEKSGYVEDLEVSSFPEDSLAVVKGRILKYHMKKPKVIIGRHSYDFDVDVDLSIEGPALKISRQQGILTLTDGRFYLENCGKRPFYVNGVPLACGDSTRLFNNSVIEIYCMKMLFNINQSTIMKIKNKSENDVKEEILNVSTK